jgi:RNA recognition motif-containing protein
VRSELFQINEGFQLIVKNIPWSVTWQQLKDAFREYGSIIRADVVEDRKVNTVVECG